MIFLIKVQLEQNKINQADRSAEGKKQQRVLSILLLRKKRATGIYIYIYIVLIIIYRMWEVSY
jgi:hypothetical protein